MSRIHVIWPSMLLATITFGPAILHNIGFIVSRILAF
jgi:hypothetical protein